MRLIKEAKGKIESSINPHGLAVILIFFISLLLLIYSTEQINLTYDSREYFSAAKSFQSTGKLLNRDGELFTNWAPLFPMVLSTFSGDLDIYRYFNLLNYLLLAFGMILLIFHLIHNKRLQILCSIWLAFSTPILMQFNFLWSEPLFITFLVFKMLFFLRFQQTSRTGYYCALVLLGILLCLQRYAGLFIIPAFVFMLISFKGVNRISVWRGLSYGMISALPIFIWIGSGYQLKGSGFSAFASNLFVSFILNLIRSYYQDIFFSWFIPNELVFQLGLYYSIVVLIILMIAWRKIEFRFTREQIFLISISLIYYLFLMLIDYSLINDRVKDFSYLSDLERYLAVIYVPVLLLFFSIIDRISVIMSLFHKQILLMVLMIWSLYPIVRTINNTIDWEQYSQRNEASLSAMGKEVTLQQTQSRLGRYQSEMFMISYTKGNASSARTW